MQMEVRFSPFMILVVIMLGLSAMNVQGDDWLYDNVEDHYIVVGNNIEATIDTKPFHLTVKDRNGNPVLESFSHTGKHYRSNCHRIEPDFFGRFISWPGGLGHRCNQYYPLSFETGGEDQFFYLNLFLIEPLAIYRRTTQHHATHVIGIQKNGAALSLKLATSHKNITLSLHIEPDPSGAAALRFSIETEGGIIRGLSTAFSAGLDEAFYGFGARRNNLDQRGNTLYSWALDGMATYSLFDGLSHHRLYAPQSLFLSSANYGLLVENSELTRFYMASDREDAWKIQVAAEQMNFVISAGDYKANIESLTTITGRHNPLPDWAKGFIFVHRSPVNPLVPPKPGPYFNKSLSHLAELKNRGIKATAYQIEAWAFDDLITDDQLSQLINQVRANGLKPMLYMREMLARDFLGTDNPSVFDEALAKGIGPTTEDGTPYQTKGNAGPYSVVDFTNPEALIWWEQRLRLMLDTGGEGFMLDFGEQVRPDMHFYNGETGRTMHNKLPILAARVTHRVIKKYEEEHPGREIMYFTRAGFSGRNGSAGFETATFLGDNLQNWDQISGLPAVIPDILNRGLGGTYNISTDIAGYFDIPTRATKELFIRWTQVATFVPLFRLHNSPIGPLVTPWSFDETAENVFKDAIALREKALPYMNQLWAEAEQTGVPLWRPMWLEYPDDPRFRNTMSQFMLGDRVLVTPVVTRGETHKNVELPNGCWINQLDRQEYQGGQAITIDAPLTALPYFFKCGDLPF